MNYSRPDWRSRRNLLNHPLTESIGGFNHYSIAGYCTEPQKKEMRLFEEEVISNFVLIPDPLKKNLADTILSTQEAEAPKMKPQRSEVKMETPYQARKIQSGSNTQKPDSLSFASIGSFISNVFNVISGAMFQKRGNPSQYEQYDCFDMYNHDESPAIDNWQPSKSNDENIQQAQSCDPAVGVSTMNTDSKCAVNNCEDKLKELKEILAKRKHQSVLDTINRHSRSDSDIKPLLSHNELDKEVGCALQEEHFEDAVSQGELTKSQIGKNLLIEDMGIVHHLSEPNDKLNRQNTECISIPKVSEYCVSLTNDVSTTTVPKTTQNSITVLPNSTCILTSDSMNLVDSTPILMSNLISETESSLSPNSVSHSLSNSVLNSTTVMTNSTPNLISTNSLLTTLANTSMTDTKVVLASVPQSTINATLSRTTTTSQSIMTNCTNEPSINNDSKSNSNSNLECLTSSVISEAKSVNLTASQEPRNVITHSSTVSVAKELPRIETEEEGLQTRNVNREIELKQDDRDDNKNRSEADSNANKTEVKHRIPEVEHRRDASEIVSACENKLNSIMAIIQEKLGKSKSIETPIHQSTPKDQSTSIKPTELTEQSTPIDQTTINKAPIDKSSSVDQDENQKTKTKTVPIRCRFNLTKKSQFTNHDDSEELSSSYENSPQIRTSKLVHYNDCFNEVTGKFHNSATDSDDSFQIVFSDSPPTRKLSDCESEDSFIVFEDTPDSCYTSTDVFGDHDSDSDHDSDGVTDSGCNLALKPDLSRTVSDLTDNSLYESERCVDVVDCSVSVSEEGAGGRSTGLLLDAEKKLLKRNQPPKQVHFSSEPPKVHVMRVWAFAARMARAGHWERHALDRERFKRRIADVDMAVSWVLKPQHRSRVMFQRFMPWWNAQRRKEIAEKKQKEEEERLRKELEKEEERIRMEEELRIEEEKAKRLQEEKAKELQEEEMNAQKQIEMNTIEKKGNEKQKKANSKRKKKFNCQANGDSMFEFHKKLIEVSNREREKNEALQNEKGKEIYKLVDVDKNINEISNVEINE